MRRARGSGGRFLNTKKLDDTRPQEHIAGLTHSGNSSGSEHLAMDSNENSDPHGEKGSLIQDKYEECTLPKVNSNNIALSSSYYPKSTGSGQTRRNFNQESWNLLVNQAPRGAASST